MLAADAIDIERIDPNGGQVPVQVSWRFEQRSPLGADKGAGMIEKRTRRRRWIKRSAIGLILLGVVGVLLVTYVPLGDGPAGDGFGPVSVELQAGSIQANNSLAASTSKSRSGNAQLLARRLAVVNQSEHMLMRRVGPTVAERLRQLPFVEQVDYFGPGTRPIGPVRLHDMYITLAMPTFDATGALVTGRTVDATVTVSAGQALFRSSHGYHDSLSPPSVRINYSAKLTHHSVTRGYESAHANYKLAAENVAAQLADSLTKHYTDWAKDDGVLGKLPAGLYPPYRAVPTDLPLPEPTAQRVWSGHGLMLHNHTTWRLESSQPEALFADLHRRLEAAGWRVDSSHGEREGQPLHLRAHKGRRIYEAFQIHDSPGTWGERPDPTPVAIIYRDRMQRDELEPVMDGVLDDSQASLETLITLTPLLRGEQRHRLLERFAANPPRHAHALVVYARLLHEQDDAEQAMVVLADAHVLARAAAADELIRRIEQRAEKIDDQNDWSPSPPTDADLQRLGFQRLEMDQPVELSLTLDEPGYFYQRIHPKDAQGAGPGPLSLISLEIRRATIPEGVYTLVLRRRDFAGGGGSSTSTPHHPPVPWRGTIATGYNQFRWHAEAEEIDDRRFRVTVHAARE